MRTRIPRRWLAAGYGALLGLVVLLQGLGNALDRQLYDALQRFNRQHFPQPLRNDVVLVGLDDAFLDQVAEPRTLSHRYLAEFLGGVSRAGAAVIGLDMVLPDKRFDRIVALDKPDQDYHRSLLAGLLEAMPRSPLVLAKVWDGGRGHYRDIHLDYAAVLSRQRAPPQALAAALFCADPDGRVRRYPGPDTDCLPDRSAATFASEISSALGVRQPWRGLINYQLGGELRYIPLQQVLDWIRSGNSAPLDRLVRGRAVLLGTVEEDTDLLTVPVPLAEWRPGNTRVPGVVLHAQVVRNMLNGGLVQPIAPALLILACWLASLFWFGAALVRKLSLFVLLSVAVLAASLFYLQRETWLEPGTPLLLAGLALALRAVLQAWHNQRQGQQLALGFGARVAPEVLQQILDGRLPAVGEAQRQQICVLQAELLGFTAGSEHLPAKVVARLLASYAERMAALVHRHGGTMLKLQGTRLGAFFGAPNRLPSAEKAALEAARDMLDLAAALQREAQVLGVSPLALHTGVHSGPATVGKLGPPGLAYYSAVGAVVEVAEQVLAQGVRADCPITCSRQVAERLGYPAVLEELPDANYGWRPTI
ncbi:adenylate/guanylate cyclase domain-containing protein [Pseudoduganella sp. OTU4001]|uniref:adenylate/guanylate cyclase domain-containing protein n=1 Tax=Pseudoduganella sp. OTU4001 TaxID=3043854 RepID=UPI00313B2658